MDNIHKSYTEKRDFVRMKLNTEVSLLLTNPERELTGICRDLSGAGILIELEEPLPIGTKCTVVIKSAYEKLKEPDFKALIEVNRDIKSASGNHQVGAQIIEILQ